MTPPTDLDSVLGDGDSDHLLLKLILSRGLISQTRLSELVEAMDQSDQPVTAGNLISLMIERGILHTESIDRLRAEVARLGDDAALTPTDASPNERAEPVHTLGDAFEIFPVKNWSRYELVEFIGRGGMGDVFKARDPRLNRYVAVKFLRRDDPQILTRFTREAQVQARIDHDNVCPVFEVGEVEGQPYIAMQYVAGGSLKEISDLLTAREKAAIMVDVADALHAAHRSGLVHRDIKPANIMVERHSDGTWRPFVVDFGIARDIDSMEITASGAVLGTPSFASPEQIRGETRSIDARTDVYSFGATLYWFLTDTAPFEGSYPEILAGVANDDPVPPHRLLASIPVDLETIVLKCLEKDPDRRYESARAVSEDLRRFLEGDPIEARRASWLYRINKKIRKHKGISAAVAIGLSAILVLAGFNLYSSIQAKKINALTQRFTSEVKEMESIMRTAAMMPLHDRSRERALIEERMDQIVGEMEDLGPIAHGPGHYALGRGFLALGQPEAATRHLEESWESGYRGALVSNALGLALGKLYQERLDAAAAIEDPELRADFKASIEKDLKAPAIEHLRRSRSISTESPAYAEGLIAFYEEDYETALSLAREAFAQVEWLYEAHKLEGDILLAKGASAIEHGRFADGLGYFDAAGNAFRAASDIARSDGSIYTGNCSRWLHVMKARSRIGEAEATAFDNAVAACNQALEIDPHSSHPYELLGSLYWQRADQVNDRGGDPSTLLDLAQEASEQAIVNDPSSILALHILGGSHIVRGLFENKRGRDPRASFDAAAQYLRRAIALRPTFVAAFDELGYAYERKAKYEQSQGLDPRPSLDLAIDSYRRAIALNPEYANAHNNLGIAFWRRAAYERRTRQNARNSLDLAISAYEAALQLNPQYAYARLNLGLAYRTAAQIDLAADRDPTPAVARARKQLNEGLKIKSDVSWALNEVVANEIIAARWALRQDASPESNLRAAQQASDRAIAVNPTSPDALQTAAQVHRWRAEFLIKSGRSAAYNIERGRALIERALSFNNRHAKAHLTRAALLLVQAESETAESTSRSLASQAKASLDTALSINPMLEIDADELRERFNEFF